MAGRINDSFLNELSSKSDIESVVSPYVVLKSRGRTLTGLCPFHSEKTPSFTVYTDNNSFYCFGCGAGGDVVTFVKRIENLDYIEAVKLLAQKAGMSMPDDGFDDTLSKKRLRMLEANRAAARFYNSALFTPAGDAALKYLTDRGLSIQTIKRFGLGLAPDSWDELKIDLHRQGFSAAELYEANLLSKNERNGTASYYDRFRNRVMIPIIDIRGNVVAFGGRALGESKAKYINTSDTLVYKKGKEIYALNFAKNQKNRSLILAEGYMDVISLHQAGFTNAVAGLGTALTRDQGLLLSRYADEILVAYDSDEAGQEATRRALAILNETGKRIRVISLKGGKDPDEIIKKYGKERFQNLIDGASNEIEYALVREKAKHDLQTSNGKMNYLKSAVEILARLSSPIERDIYASKMAEELSVEKQSIMTSVEAARKKNIRKTNKEKYHELEKITLVSLKKDELYQYKNSRVIKAEELLITALLCSQDIFQKIKGEISPDDFISVTNKKIFKILYDRLTEKKDVELSLLAAEFGNDEMSIITKLYLIGNQTGTSLAECRECINVIINEKNKTDSVNPENLSDEDFLKLFKKD